MLTQFQHLSLPLKLFCNKLYIMQKEEINELTKNMEVVGMLEGFVSETIETTLVDPDECWQPTDFLPEMTQEDALDQVKKLRERTAAIPDSVITSLVGNMITEEALPSYQTYFNLMVNTERNLTSPNGWVRWSRAWTAEENRHGDLLNKYLYLSGRCDMKEVEQTIQQHWLGIVLPKSFLWNYGNVLKQVAQVSREFILQMIKIGELILVPKFH